MNPCLGALVVEPGRVVLVDDYDAVAAAAAVAGVLVAASYEMKAHLDLLGSVVQVIAALRRCDDDGVLVDYAIPTFHEDRFRSE